MEKFWTRISDPKDLIKIGKMLKANTTLKVGNHYFNNPDKTEIGFIPTRKWLEWTKDNGKFYTNSGFKQVDNSIFYAKARKYYPKSIKIMEGNNILTKEEYENLTSLENINQISSGDKLVWVGGYGWMSPGEIITATDIDRNNNRFSIKKSNEDTTTTIWSPDPNFKLYKSNLKPKVEHPCPDVNKLGTWGYQGRGFKIVWEQERYRAYAIHPGFKYEKWQDNWQDGPGWIPIETGEFTSETGKHFAREKAYKHQKRTPWDPEL